MPSSEDNLASSININQAFLEQEDVQSFLGYPIPRLKETVVPSDLLYKFLQIARHALINEIKRQGLNRTLNRTLNSLKFGYERKVLLSESENTYRIDSQFVAEQGWVPSLEVGLDNQVQFLTDSERDPSEIKPVDDPLTDYLIDLNEVSADGLYHIYPELKNCLEIHVYVFANFSEVVRENGNSPLESSSSGEDDSPNTRTSRRLIILAAQSCPGCQKSGVYESNAKINKEGVCETCPSVDNS